MNHETYIARCLYIAQNGIGSTRPNPSVGAVVVHDGVIIGEGVTSPYGGPHAEVNALAAVKHPELLKEATVYVTLEPCSHTGKTPPCADLLIKHQVKRVVVGCIDTHSVVAGKGIERLRKAGCEVIVGVMETACQAHHKRFFTFHNKKRPYIILKWAMSKDGYIAPLQKNEQAPVWISSAHSQQLVHKWRSQEHAILVGTNTVLADNPSLTVRHWSGNHPTRVVLDRQLRIPRDLHVYNNEAPTLIFTEQVPKTINDHTTFVSIDFSKNLPNQICDALHQHQIQSLIVEGGRQTLQSFIDAGLWDEARVFVGPNKMGSGTPAPTLTQQAITEENYMGDQLKYYTND